ncbi:MAG: hypothetical protein ACK5RL_02365 [Acidimicrobiales bacterium]
MAERYEGDPAVAAEGELLVEIGDGYRTSVGELNDASVAIASLCGQTSLNLYSVKLRLNVQRRGS